MIPFGDRLAVAFSDSSELGLMALPRVYVGQSDDARRMAAKRLLFRGYIAVKGRRP